MKVNWKIFSISIIFVLVIVSRFVNLGSNPVSLYWDELAIGSDGYAMAQTGSDLHGNRWLQPIIPSYGDYKAPVAIWIVALFVKVLGLSELSVRLPYALFALIGVVGLGLLLRQFAQELNLGKNVSWFLLLSLLLLLTSPWHFHFSRIGFESGLSITFVIFSILFTLYGLKKNQWWLLLGGIMGVVSIYTYFSTRYIMPLFVGVVILTYWRQAWQRRWMFVAAIGVFVALQLPLFSSDLYKASQDYRLSTPSILNNQEIYKESATQIYESGNTILPRVIYHRYWFFCREFFDNYAKHFSSQFLFLSGDLNLRHHSGWGGELLAFSSVPLLLGLYWVLRNWRTRIAFITIVWFLVAPITAALPYEVPHASRSVYLLLPITVLFFLGIYQAWSLTKSRLHLPLIATSAFLIGLLINYGLYLEDYFVHYPVRSGQAWQVGNTYIGKTIRDQRNQFEKIIVTEEYWKPVMAILFYNPEYIIENQKITKSKNRKYDYFWLYQFDSISYGDPDVRMLEKNTLYLTKPKPEYAPLAQKSFVFPDGSEAVYAISLKAQ